MGDGILRMIAANLSLDRMSSHVNFSITGCVLEEHIVVLGTSRCYDENC